MKISNHKLILDITTPSTVDEILTKFQIARKQRYFLYQKRCIQVNGMTISQSISLQQYDQLCIYMDQEQDNIPSWNYPIEICYEDDIILIVAKPSGMLVHSDGCNRDHTLCNAIQYYYEQSHQAHLVRPIHRLDVETSGLMLFCKEPFFQPMLDHMLETKVIHREYQAIVTGQLQKAFYDIQAPIARDRHNAKKMRIDPDGKQARTIIQLLQQQSNIALVSCRLFTGRTHQIRVHLASIHHAILSDCLYGKSDKRIARCALHAYQLTFIHPMTKEEVVVICELPTDMKNLLQ